METLKFKLLKSERLNYLLLLAFQIAFINTNAQWSYLGNEVVDKMVKIQHLVQNKQGTLFVHTTDDSTLYKYENLLWQEIKLSSIYSNIKTSGIIKIYANDLSNKLYLHGYFVDINNNTKVFLTYYDGTQWHQVPNTVSIFNSPSSFISSMCSDKFGNFYATNLVNSSGNPYVATYNGINWSELGGNNSISAYGGVNSICVDNFGTIYASGISPSPNYVPFILKYDGSSWSKMPSVYFGEDTSYAYTSIELKVDTYGNLYAFRGYKNKVTNQLNFLAKYDGQKWVEQTEIQNWTTSGFRPYNFEIDFLNNIYLYGSSTGNNAESQFIILKYDGINWSEIKGIRDYACNNSNTIEKALIDKQGSLYVVGDLFNSNCYPLVAKYKDAHLVDVFEESANLYKLVLFPNPFTNQLTLSSEQNNLESIRIYDISGKLVFYQLLEKTQQQNLDMSELPKGLYIAQVNDSNGYSQRLKLVKQ